MSHTSKNFVLDQRSNPKSLIGNKSETVQNLRSYLAVHPDPALQYRLEKIQTCGSPVRSFVEVEYHPGGKHIVKGIQTCKDPTFCPHCAEFAAAKHRAELAGAWSILTASGILKGAQIVHANITARHTQDDDPKALYQALLDANSKWTERVKKKGFLLGSLAVGEIAPENPDFRNGLHPHVHDVRIFTPEADVLTLHRDCELFIRNYLIKVLGPRQDGQEWTQWDANESLIILQEEPEAMLAYILKGSHLIVRQLCSGDTKAQTEVKQYAHLKGSFWSQPFEDLLEIDRCRHNTRSRRSTGCIKKALRQFNNATIQTVETHNTVTPSIAISAQEWRLMPITLQAILLTARFTRAQGELETWRRTQDPQTFDLSRPFLSDQPKYPPNPFPRLPEAI